MSRQKDSIKLHPKYGLNPSVGICFWCGETTGEIILYGGEIKEEAPRQTTISYAPCDKCAEKWHQGFLFIEVNTQPNVEGQPPVQEGFYPTGNYMVITMEAAAKLLKGNVPEVGAAIVDMEVFQKLAEAASKAEGEEL